MNKPSTPHELNETQIFAIKNRLTAILLNNEIVQRNLALGRYDQSMFRLQKNQEEIQKVNFMMNAFENPEKFEGMSFFNIEDCSMAQRGNEVPSS